jgi:hypothetical protein
MATTAAQEDRIQLAEVLYETSEQDGNKEH